MGNLHRMLTSERLLGYTVIDPPDRKGPGVVVRGADGLPVQRAEPIVRPAELERVRATLGARGGVTTRADRQNGHLLTGVLFCGLPECGRPFYYLRGHGGRADRYRCSSKSIAGQACGNRSVPAVEFEHDISFQAVLLVGATSLTRRIWEPGTDNGEEVERLTRALADLRDDRSAGLYSGPQGTEEYRAAYAALEQRRQELSAVEGSPGRWVDVPTGQNFPDTYVAADLRGRNELLRAIGLWAIVLPDGMKLGVARPADYTGPALTTVTEEMRIELRRRASGATGV